MDLGNCGAGITEKMPAYPDTHTTTHQTSLTVSKGTKTIQEILNDMNKYAMQMIHLPDIYMFHNQFVSALHDSLHN